ncbi:MAG: TetR/AcrR family transcriptional regulator [Cytophagales bacterium]|nr:MAG: TetR/AcrR family transcriptional regulator [Cytophagales bacterium]
MIDKSAITQQYISYMLENGKKPVSIYAFSKILEISESEFYNFYSSFESIEKDIWNNLFVETVETLESDQTYQEYSSKDKLLAFYYMWVQKLRNNRSYIVAQKCQKSNSILFNNESLESFKNSFYKYLEQIIQEGVEKNEIKDRKFLTDKYAHGFWMQTLFILNYWIKDSSLNFEMTDAAIEKSVNLSFKLIADNALDSLVDFGKFIFQKTN